MHRLRAQRRLHRAREPADPRVSARVLPLSAVSLLFTVVFLDLVGFGIVLPLLPSYAARAGAGTALIGLLIASDSLLQFLVAPWWGRLSDRVGRRPVLLAGLAGSLLAAILFGVAGGTAIAGTAGGFLLLLLSRVVAGATGSTAHVAQAYLADVTPAERRAHAMGLVGAAFGLGFTVGPALGGIATRFGDAAPGALAALLGAANLALAWWRLAETRVHVPAEPRPRPRAMAAEWRVRFPVYGAMFGATFAFTVMYVVFPLFCQQLLGYGRARVSYLFVFIGVVTIAVQGRLVGRLAPRWGEPRLMVAGGALMAAGFGLLPLSAGAGAGAPLAILLAALLLLTTGFCLVGPALAGWVSRTTSVHEQGRALGALQSVGSMARIAGPPMLGLVGELGGLRAPFLAATLAAAAASLLAARVRRHLGMKTAAETSGARG